MNSRILVISLLALVFTNAPATVQAQQVLPISDARGSVPNFYSIDGKPHWCTPELKARRIAKEGNDLRYCRGENDKLLARILEKDSIIRSYDQIVANHVAIQEAQKKQIEQHEEARRNLDESVKTLKNDKNFLEKENKDLKDLAGTRWYRSPFLWFGVGIATAIGTNYVWELQTDGGRDN